MDARPHAPRSSAVALLTPWLLLAPPGAVAAPSVPSPPTEPEAAPSPAPDGSTIVAVGGGALVVDADAGVVALTDTDGNPTSSRKLSKGLSLAAVAPDGTSAFVVDRQADRVHVLDLDRRLRTTKTFATRTEPYGIALTPDGTLAVVSSVASRRLTAYDAKSGVEQWSVVVGPEPRGVAIAPDGRSAVVTLLGREVVARVSWSEGTPALSHEPLASGRELLSDWGPPRLAFARAAMAAVFVDEDTVVVPHQLDQPVDPFGMGETYGGADELLPPVSHRLARLDGRTTTTALPVHQPRAVAYDAARDRLAVAGLGSSELATIDGARVGAMNTAATVDLGSDCGPDGVAFRPDGAAMVHCSLSRRVVVVDGGRVTRGPELGDSSLSPAEQRGRALFVRGDDPRLSVGGFAACSSCHPEGRSDGLSWSIDGQVLQTPILAGRLEGTHPYKWDGRDKTLAHSLKGTIARLGGDGLRAHERKDLEAYVRSLPAPRTASERDPKHVAHGEALFHEAGCDSCHVGPRLTDRRAYRFGAGGMKVDTPSLVGLAASAPYLHDGSATTLRAALLDNGSVHGMGDTTDLGATELDHLVAYLETL